MACSVAWHVAWHVASPTHQSSIPQVKTASTVEISPTKSSPDPKQQVVEDQEKQRKQRERNGHAGAVTSHYAQEEGLIAEMTPE